MARMGDRHARQQLQHCIDHQFRQQLAGHKDHACFGLPEPTQLKQLPFFVVVHPLHQSDLLGIEIEGWHHQHIPGVC